LAGFEVTLYGRFWVTPEEGRELIVDLRSLTAISPEGKDVLLQLMSEKVKLISGVYMREVLRQLGLKTRNSLRDATDYTDPELPPPE